MVKKVEHRPVTFLVPNVVKMSYNIQLTFEDAKSGRLIFNKYTNKFYQKRPATFKRDFAQRPKE